MAFGVRPAVTACGQPTKAAVAGEHDDQADDRNRHEQDEPRQKHKGKRLTAGDPNRP
jgi:hypothetical protein